MAYVLQNQVHHYAEHRHVHVRVFWDIWWHDRYDFEVSMRNCTNNMQLWTPQVLEGLSRCNVSRAFELCLVHPINCDLENLVDAVFRWVSGGILRRHFASFANRP